LNFLEKTKLKFLRNRFLRHALLVCFRPLRKLILHQYPYNYSPRQLVTLINLLDKALSHCPNGAVLEVGCFSGHTTTFLSRHLYTCSYSGYHYAYDTFKGFTDSDVKTEINAGRLSSRNEFDFSFTTNNQRWVQWTIDQNKKMAKVHLVKTDAAVHQFEEIEGPLAFVLIDVDVYQPTLNSLNRLWPKLSPGGFIVIDDCLLSEDGAPITDRKFCGGHQALLEWAKKEEVLPKYTDGKLAIINKPFSD
jgi:O-methyltransferase